MAFGVGVTLDQVKIAQAKKEFSGLLNDLKNVADRNVINIKVNNSLNDMNNDLKQINSTTSTTNNNFKTLGSSVGNLTGFFLKWLGVASAVTATIRELKNGIEEIVAINRSNVNIAMITGQSIENVQKMNQGWLQMAKTLKVVNSEVMAGAESWLRSGVNMDEANKNLETTTKLAKIAGESNQEMADSLVTIKNAYGLNSQALENYASKVSLLDNSSATSSEKINSAMMYSAETFKSMGVDMDTALSYITAFSEKSAKSGEAIGRGYVSLLDNFHKMQAGVKAGSEEEVQAVNKIESILNQKGIALRKNKDEWIDLGTVIKNIQLNINKFSDVEKSELAFRIGGKEQSEQTLNLLTNLKRITELNNKLKDDSGAKALNESYSKYLDSIDAKVSNLKNTATELWTHLINANAIKGTVSGITKIIDTIDALTTKSKGMGIALVAISTTSILVAKNFTSLNIILSNFAIVAGKAGVVAALSDSFSMLGSAIGKVSLALLSSPWTWATLAIAGVTAAIVSHVHHLQELQEQTDKNKESYKDLIKSMKEMDIAQQKASADDLKKQQTDLQGLINKRKELAEELKNNPNDGSREMIAIHSHLQAELDKTNGKVTEQTKALKDAGYTVDENTGKIKELGIAESNITRSDTIEKINEETQAQIQHADSITQLIDRYNVLANTNNRSKAQNQEMNDVIEQLQSSVSGLTVSVDEHGNKLIKNVGLLGQEKTAIEDEKNAAIASANSRINAESAKMQVLINGSYITVETARKNIETYKKEMQAYQQLQAVKNNTQHEYVPGNILNDMVDYDATIDAMNQIEASLDKNKIGYSGIGGGTNSPGYTPPSSSKGGSSSKSSSSTSKTPITSDIERLDTYKNSMDKVTESIDAQEKSLESLDKEVSAMSDSKDYEATLQKQDQLLQSQKKHADELKKSLSDTNAIKNNITKALQSMGASYSDTLSQSALEQLYDKKFGGSRTFTSDAAKKAFEDQANAFKKLMDDLKSVNDLQDNINSKIQDTGDKVKSITSEIEKSMENINNQTKEIMDNLSSTMDDMISKVSTALKNKYEAEKKAVVDPIDADIQRLQDELNALQDDTADKQNTLTALQGEYNAWSKVDTVEGKAKSAELKAEIDKQQKQMEIDAKKKEIADKEADKSAKEKYYDTLEEQDNIYKQSVYLLENNQAEVISLLQNYYPEYKNQIDQFGNTFKNSITESIKTAIQNIQDLMAKIDELNNKKVAWVNNPVDYAIGQAAGYNTQYITGSTTSTSIGDNDVFIGASGSSNLSSGHTTYQGSDRNDTASMVNGKPSVVVNTATDAAILQAQYGNNVNIVVSQGNGYVGADREATNNYYKNVLAGQGLEAGNAGNLWRFNTGGYTGNSEGIAYLDKKELILNEKDTKNTLEAMHIGNEMVSMLSKFNLSDISKNLYNTIPSVKMPDYTNLLKSRPSNEYNAPVVSNEFNITNNTPFDVQNNADNMERKIKNQLGLVII